MAAHHKLAVFCLDPSAVGSGSPGPKQAGEPRRRGRRLIRYNRRMAASPPRRSASRDSPSGPTATEISTAALAHLNTLGLTEEEMSRIEAAATAAHADSTQVVYAHAWHRWSTWARTRGLQELPADPAAVCAYLTERASQGVSMSTINVACSAIGHQHRIHGLDNPTTHAGVRQGRRGLRRTLGTAPRRLARALDSTDIRRIVTPIDLDTAAGMRDTAIILLGFASALRRAELAALTLADLEFRSTGLLLHVRQSKTDPEGHGQVVAVAPGRHLRTDPLAALDRWLTRRGPTPGPLFTSMRNYRLTDVDPISGNAIALMLRNRARAAGIPPERVTGHSLRAGHATTAARAGVSIDRIAAQTRHKRVSILIERYIRPVDALENTSSRDLGL